MLSGLRCNVHTCEQFSLSSTLLLGIPLFCLSDTLARHNMQLYFATTAVATIEYVKSSVAIYS